MAALRASARHGLEPSRYDLGRLSELIGEARRDRGDAARAEALLSRTFVAYVRDLRGATGEQLAFRDPGLRAPATDPQVILAAAAAAPSLDSHLDAVERVNPLYDEFRRSYAGWRERWMPKPSVALPSGPALRQGARGAQVKLLRQRLELAKGDRFDRSVAEALRAFQTAHGLRATGAVDAATRVALNRDPARYDALIRANLDRVRALPPEFGRRYVLVDAVAQQLRLYENGRVVDSMRVIVGKPDQQTPSMAGLIRFAVLNPYWNLPPDLVPTRVADGVLRDGPGFLRKARFEALSGWTPDARVLKAREVDWRAVASGRSRLRVRQLPGPANVMGAVKFMLPNPLGIYLHDTPEKAAFRQPERLLSSGCVRVEDAPRLARWLFGGKAPKPSGAAEQRVDLPAPVPVYIAYLTAASTEAGIAFRRDIYGRDSGAPTGLAD